MSPPSGPIGEAGATARSLINGLSSSPLVLALVVIDLATLGLLYWQGTLGESERRTSLELLYKNRSEVSQLLAKCK
jgi:hypothetical protein